MRREVVVGKPEGWGGVFEVASGVKRMMFFVGRFVALAAARATFKVEGSGRR